MGDAVGRYKERSLADGGVLVSTGDRLDSYNAIKRQEFARLRRMSATQSLRLGIVLITEVVEWKKQSGSSRRY